MTPRRRPNAAALELPRKELALPAIHPVVQADRLVGKMFVTAAEEFPGRAFYIDPDPIVAPDGRPALSIDVPEGSLRVRKVDLSHYCPDGSALMFTLSMGGRLSRIGPQRSGSHVRYPHTNPVVAPPPPVRIGERSRVATFRKSEAPSIWFDPEPPLKQCGSPCGKSTTSPGDRSRSASPSRDTRAEPSTTK